MNRSDDDTFYDDIRQTVPLGPWLDRCERAGVPFIPGAFSPAFPLVEMYAALDDKPHPRLDLAWTWMEAQIARYRAANRRWMVRTQDGATGWLKHAAAEGLDWCEAYSEFTVDDPLLYDRIVTEPVRICVRPWIEPRRIEGYPLEFRAFWGPDSYQGVSSYYPQRPLPPMEEQIIFLGGKRSIRDIVHECIGSAKLLTGSPDLREGFTADFLVSTFGAVLFLEGGPPHYARPHLNAHPCCFAPGQVKGVALSKREGALDE